MSHPDTSANRPSALHHVLLVSILLMGLVLIAGLGLVIYGFATGLSTAPDDASTAYVRDLALPAGAHVVGSYAVGEALAIEIALADGGRVIHLLDPATGHEVGRVRASGAGGRE